MKATILKFLKIALIAAACILAVLLVFGIVLSLNWPWWVGFFLVLILIGAGIGALALRKMLLKRKEQRFVQQVIEQDEAQLKKLSDQEKSEMKELQKRWKEAIEVLRRSHLRKHGNPLYVLPWYLVIGESGAGKTTAIRSARVSSPFAEYSHTSGISGTRNCEWWFFEQAIILDTAGRYAVPVDETKDMDEWQQFLAMMVKYRRKEPLNGLIVTVSADKILGTSPEGLEEEGKTIRRRIDELMRVLGVKFPVYLLVTKSDLIQGMTQFCDHLPEESLKQPMGFVSRDLTKDVSAFLDRAMTAIGERLRHLRLLLLSERGAQAVDTGLLLFPEELENMRKGLEAFMKPSFQENPFQETPVLRGLFFSSGRQEGSPYSHFLNSLGLISERDVLPGTNRGLFLHDFFAKILPGDRELFTPTKRAVEWQALTRNLGLTAWVVLGIALCGLLSFSFVKNLRAVREISREFANPPVLRGELVADLVTMERFRQALLKVEDRNRHWWIPRFGLNESTKVEEELKARYCKQFQDGFLASFDKQMTGELAQFTASTSDEVVGHYIVHLVRRINLLKARLDGRDFAALQAKAQPSYVSLVSTPDRGIEPELRKKFGQLYLYYLAWRPDTAEISKEKAVLQTWLKHLLTLKGAGLHWLAGWVNNQGSVSPLTLKDFWGGSVNISDESSVAPAFTRKGKEMIDSFVKELEAAHPDPLALEGPKLSLEKWYKGVCFDSWRNFAAFFPRGAERLKGANEWRQAAAGMATDQGPYFAFLNRLASELAPLAGDAGGEAPLWLQQVFQFQVLKSRGVAGALVSKTAEEGKKLLTTVEKTLGKKVDDASAVESHAAALKALQEYQNALAAIASASSSKNQAYQMAVQVYTEDPSTSKSPLYSASAASARLKSGMAGAKLDETFWNLAAVPLTYLWTYGRMETASSLQSQWEEKVLAEIQGASGQQAMQYLLGQEGPVWKFVKGPAAPFLGWNVAKGYYSKEALGGSLAFDRSFFAFLSKGAKAQATATAKQNYSVAVRGLPTSSNPEARRQPHSTRLELQCASGGQTLVNLNFPVSKTYTWSPDACGDVTFQVEVGDVVLIKRYTGPQAFPEFLQDFNGGRRTFYPNDFPREKGALDRLGIKYIKVSYQFSGDRAVAGQAGALPGQAPRTIVRCWE